MTWLVQREVGSAGAFHARDVAAGTPRSVWVLDVDRPTVVLGSTQRDDVLDPEAVRAAGVEVVRRRSGGGVVVLRPGEVCWLDVIVPAGDPQWDDDVARAFHWLGDVWAAATATATATPAFWGSEVPQEGVLAHPERGSGRLVVHRGALVRNQWSSLVCFAGLGPGEVTVDGAAKLVGISARRTRTHARFQCVMHRRFDAADTVGLLALDESDSSRLHHVLAAGVATVPLASDDLVEAFLTALP